jgi:hypothetical protein
VRLICSTVILFDVVIYFRKSISRHCTMNFRLSAISSVLNFIFEDRVSIRVYLKMFDTPFAM